MIFSPLAPAKPTKVYEYFWRLAAERQEIFFNKINNVSPLTEDPILLKYKFTNTYRASDRVSQYLIRNVIYKGSRKPEEVFFRIILFKTFNKIETWNKFLKEFREVRYADYSFQRYNRLLTSLMRSGERIYSAAYIMASGSTVFGYKRKHSNHLKVIEKMMKDEVPKRITECKSMQSIFELLRSYPTLGDFLAYQYATDINYSELTNFNEMSFVVPGPGAFDGIKKCFKDLGGLTEVEIIKFMAEIQQREFKRFGIKFRDLWGRPMQLIDCQNVFCEISKYSRVKFPDVKGESGRTRIKQSYHPKNDPIDYWYPPKWELNDSIYKKTPKSFSKIFKMLAGKGVGH